MAKHYTEEPAITNVANDTVNEKKFSKNILKVTF